MPKFGLLEMVSSATLVVQLVLGLLVVMSLASWTIIFLKLITLSKAKKQAREDLKLFQSAKSLRSAVKKLGDEADSPAYGISQEGLRELSRLEESKNMYAGRTDVIMDNLRRSLRQGVNEQIAKLTGSISFLATCANAAPFIGLFGTVWGIMHSFHSIGMMKTASLAVVAPGISEALVATAIGLAVAIPATIFYNFFLSRLGLIESELIGFAGAFLNRVQRELNTAADQD